MNRVGFIVQSGEPEIELPMTNLVDTSNATKTSRVCSMVAMSLHHLNVKHIFAVAGKPVTALGEVLAREFDEFEWSINEKVATEAAVGVSAAGQRSALLFKQCGLNTALDSLINAVHHGIAGALVVFVGDDIDASSSTTLQDSRFLAVVASIPVLELSRESADTLVQQAFELSESVGIPVLVRFTDAIYQPEDEMTYVAGSTSERSVRTTSPLLDLHRAHQLTKLGRHQHHRIHIWPVVQEFVDKIAVVNESHADDCQTGFISVGASHVTTAVDQNSCHIAMQASWPVPGAVRAFAATHERVCILEEPKAFIEQALLGGVASEAVLGRTSAHLPPEGRLKSPDVESIFEGTDDARPHWISVELKGDATIRCHPYENLFQALTFHASEGAFISTDVGSSVKLCYPPYSAASVALCLGGAIGVAGGHARATRRAAIAVIGDYGLLHSGLESLIEMVHRQIPVVVIVLANGISSQTGSQPTAASAEFSSPIVLDKLVNALGISEIDRWWEDEQSPDQAAKRIQTLLDLQVPCVAFVSEGAGIAGLDERPKERRTIR